MATLRCFRLRTAVDRNIVTQNGNRCFITAQTGSKLKAFFVTLLVHALDMACTSNVAMFINREVYVLQFSVRVCYDRDGEKTASVFEMERKNYGKIY